MNDVRPACRLCLRPLIVDGGICGECLDEMDRQWGAWAMVAHRPHDRTAPPLVLLGQGEYADEMDFDAFPILGLLVVAAVFVLAVWALMRWWT